MSSRFQEIAETNHRILNPFGEEKLLLLGELCDLHESMRLLDLACGKGEMLVQWAQTYGVMGVGVDSNSAFIEAAKDRAFVLDVSHKLSFIVDDAADYPQEHHVFDAVCCLGATWIGGGLDGTLALMRSALRSEGGLLLVGELFWQEPPTEAVLAGLEVESGTYTSLGGLLERFEAAGLELVEMLMADADQWDRYEARQWAAVRTYMDENPDDDNLEALHAWINKNRHAYLGIIRRHMGWGVFVLRESGKPIPRTSYPRNPDRPVGVDIAENMLWVRLDDGRVIGHPLEWYPWLQNATPEQVEAIELTTNSLIWTDLDRRLEVKALLRGRVV